MKEKQKIQNKTETRDVLLGLVIFITVCLLASWLGEKMHDPEDYWSCNGPYSDKDDSLPGCPEWLINQ